MGRYLIDTQVLLWLNVDAARVPYSVHQQLSDPENDVLASIVSMWEIAIKQSVGKLARTATLAEMLRILRLEELPLRLDHIEQARSLPWFHRDPFDRMLVAQAQVERLTLVTSDRRLAAYDVSILRA